MIRNVVVGAGFSGATLAHKLAAQGEEVLMIEARNHIAGNCYDFWDKNGICVHQYGTHIFHTNLKEVWDYVSEFTQWYPYMHQVKGYIDGQEAPIPFNLNSIHQLFPKSIADNLEIKLIEKFGYNVKVPILELRKARDKDLEGLADYIYEKVFLHYTLKQWGMRPEDMDSAVTGRVPVYISRDNRYFQDTYQGIPLRGYTAIVEKMLDNPLIKVRLNTKWSDVQGLVEYDRLFFTGPIDEFFGYELGELPYRSLKFCFLTFDREYFQSGACINYPNNYDFTRIGEYKYFLDNKSNETVVSYEYPQAFERGKNERYYPIVKEANLALYNRYLEKAQKLTNVYFCGRLGDYKYYDMDKAIARALNLFKQINEEDASMMN